MGWLFGIIFGILGVVCCGLIIIALLIDYLEDNK